MPLISYTCGSCRSQVEILVRGREEPECPECGGKKLERQLSLPVAHIAGGRSNSLPMASSGNCGLPQCGQGRCGRE